MSFWSVLRAPHVAPAAPLPRPLDTAVCMGLGALGFFLPFSVAGVALSLAALVLLALVAAPAVWRSAPWREPVIAVGLALLAYIALHTLLTGGLTLPVWHLINRYHELLLAPVLLALFRLVSDQRVFLRGLCCGAVVYAAAHWCALFVPELATYLHPRRISAGFGLAVCSFVLAEQARTGAHAIALRLVAAFLALTVLFAIGGRTGHLVLLLLVGCTAWLHSPRRWRWGAALALPLLVLTLALGSSAVQKRVGETVAELKESGSGELQSTGIRVELLRNGLALAGRHFLTGAGYTRYGEIHEKAARARYGADPARQRYMQERWVRTTNPHTEYLMQLVGGGVLALALFLAWLVLPLLRRAASGGAQASLAGISLAFALGCLFNSMLMDFVEGHLYVALLAWLLVQSPAADASATAPAGGPA